VIDKIKAPIMRKNILNDIS